MGPSHGVAGGVDGHHGSESTKKIHKVRGKVSPFLTRLMGYRFLFKQYLYKNKLLDGIDANAEEVHSFLRSFHL